MTSKGAFTNPCYVRFILYCKGLQKDYCKPYACYASRRFWLYKGLQSDRKAFKRTIANPMLAMLRDSLPQLPLLPQLSPNAAEGQLHINLDFVKLQSKSSPSSFHQLSPSAAERQLRRNWDFVQLRSWSSPSSFRNCPQDQRRDNCIETWISYNYDVGP